MTEETSELTEDIINEAATVIAYACWANNDRSLKLTVTNLNIDDIAIGDYVISVKKL